jgi:hypothetical protein
MSLAAPHGRVRGRPPRVAPTCFFGCIPDIAARDHRIGCMGDFTGQSSPRPLETLVDAPYRAQRVMNRRWPADSNQTAWRTLFFLLHLLLVDAATRRLARQRAHHEFVLAGTFCGADTPEYSRTCLMKQSWALRGRNPARDNQAEGAPTSACGPWPFSQGPPFFPLPVGRRAMPCKIQPTSAAAQPCPSLSFSSSSRFRC